MSNLKITDLKKYLKDKDMNELQKEIIDIVKNFKDVKEYYSLKVNPDMEIKILEKYKKIVKNEFFPERGNCKMRYSIVNKAIREFKKVSNSLENIADLMLFYVRVGVNFTNEYGDIDDEFYDKIERAYENALEYIVKNNLEDKFNEIAKKLYVDVSHIDWGFGECMEHTYLINIGDKYEEE